MCGEIGSGKDNTQTRKKNESFKGKHCQDLERANAAIK